MENRALEAARLIYGEAGKAHVTFNSVAARAGVGKPALYRRWETPEQLLMDALREVPLPTDIEDRGDLQAELAHYASQLMRLYLSPDGASVMRLATEFHDESEPFRKLISETSGGMIELTRSAINRAIHRGERAPEMSADFITELIAGGVLSHTVVRMNAGQVPPDEEVDEYCRRLAAVVLGRSEMPAEPPSSRHRKREAQRREKESEINRQTGQRSRTSVDATYAENVDRGRPESRRDELVRIAQQLAADEGFADLKLAEVASHAGLTAPAMYTHFASRDDLLEQVLETTAREYVEDLRSTDDPNASVDERLRVRLRRWATFPNARLRILNDAILHMSSSAAVKAAVQRARGAWSEFVKDVLVRGIERGEVRADIDIDATVDLLSCTLFGVQVAADTGLTERPLLDLTERLATMFIDHMHSDGRRSADD